MKRIRRAWARWRARHTAQPIIVELCEVCGRGLTEDEVWELRSTSSISDAERAEMSMIGVTGGGMYMSAAYCVEHFPADRERWVKS